MFANLRWRVARQFRQPLDQGLRLADHDFRNQPVPKVGEQFLVASQETAVQQRKNRVRMIGIELDEFGNNSRRRVALQSNFRSCLAKTVGSASLNFSAASSVAARKTSIDIRIGKKSLPAEIADGGKTIWEGSSPAETTNCVQSRRTMESTSADLLAQIFQSIFRGGKFCCSREDSARSVPSIRC